MGAFTDHLTKSNQLVQTKNSFYEALLANDFMALESILKSLFASIAYNNFTGVRLYEYEGYYVSVFYSYLKALGIEVLGEDVTNKGRIDLTIILADVIYVVEFKVDETDALSQIKEKGYDEKYLDRGKSLYIVGISFDTKERNISNLEFEKIV